MHSPRYLIVGLGKTGHSIARFLRRRKQSFLMFDTRQQAPGVAEFGVEFPDVDIFLGTLPETIYAQLAGVIMSPGVALDHPSIQRALDVKIPIYGDIECFAHEVHAPIVAITGTNGKSTVTTLVGEMAKAAGLNVAVAGNIGLPVLDLLQDDMQYDLWVLELSSFQLELTHSLAPAAATVLNISPDHLDRHHTIEAYTNAKQRIYHQANYAFYNRADPLTVPQLPLTKRSSFGLDTPTAGQWGIMTEKNGEQYLAFGDNLILPANAMRLKGQHNWSNALAACGLAQAVGIPIHCMRDVLQNFSGLSHRSQWVRTFESVDWINDSKGTNIGATISAISGIGGSMQGKIVLIAGGQGKGADFTELRKPVADFVRSIVLIGEDAPKIEQSLHDLVHVLHATSLEEAVLVAKAQAKPGDVVLLSPACASLDMFRDFNHRGEVFTEAVGKL